MTESANASQRQNRSDKWIDVYQVYISQSRIGFIASNSRWTANGCLICALTPSMRYPNIHITTETGRRMYQISRIVYELYHGKYDTSMRVCHKCDDTKCINPLHLFLGTTLDNHNDMVAKGRGSVRGNFLTEAEIALVKELYLAGMTQLDIAFEFNVARPSISRYINGRSIRG